MFLESTGASGRSLIPQTPPSENAAFQSIVTQRFRWVDCFISVQLQPSHNFHFPNHVTPGFNRLFFFFFTSAASLLITPAVLRCFTLFWFCRLRLSAVCLLISSLIVLWTHVQSSPTGAVFFFVCAVRPGSDPKLSQHWASLERTCLQSLQHCACFSPHDVKQHVVHQTRIRWTCCERMIWAQTVAAAARRRWFHSGKHKLQSCSKRQKPFHHVWIPKLAKWNQTKRGKQAKSGNPAIWCRPGQNQGPRVFSGDFLALIVFLND